MPNIGAYHPIIVHFAIALLLLGVIFRWVSLTGRAPFSGPAAATLLILGAVAALLAVHSGLDAHGPVERIPGARQAVGDHEDAGVWARNVFLGTRSGDTADVTRLYLAGLYQAAQQARAQHDSARAAVLFTELERQFPNDTNVRLLAIESLVRDKHEGRLALNALARFPAQADDRRLQLRIGFLKADAYIAVAKPDSARAVLEQLGTAFPDMQQRIKERERMIDNQ